MTAYSSRYPFLKEAATLFQSDSIASAWTEAIFMEGLTAFA